MVFRTTTALEDLLVVFDPTVQYVAVINKSDGRIRVFNAVTCALHVDITKKLGSKHRTFTSNLCSACWSLQDGSRTPRLIVAASSGRVVSFDISKVSQIWSADDIVSGDLSWIAASGTGSVAAVSTEGDVSVHDAVTGKRKWKSAVGGQPLTYCTFSEDTDRLVVASTYLFVFSEKEVALKLSGHAAPVSCAAVTPDGEFTLSGATGDSSLALFSSRMKKHKGEEGRDTTQASKVPTRRMKLQLGLAEPPRSIVCAACDSESEDQSQRDCSHAFVAAAVTEGGTARAWKCTKEGKSWRGHLRCSIRSDTPQEAVLGVTIASENVLVVVHGVPLQPRIHRVTLNPDDSEREIVLPSAGQMLAPKELPESKKVRSPRAMALGADNAGLPVNVREGSDSAQDTATPMDAEDLPPHTATNGLASIDSNLNPDAKAAADAGGIDGGQGGAKPQATGGHPNNKGGEGEGNAADEGGYADGEEPLMTRVARLVPRPDVQRVTLGDLKAVGADGSQQGAVTADSLTVLLSQAIRAADDVLIDKVLSSARGAVLKRTVARLPASDAPQFATALVDRMRRTPARAASVLPWLRSTLTQHASVLTAAPTSRAAMALLAQITEQRTSLLGPMLALRGRLEVLVAAAQPADSEGDAAASLEPLKPLVEVSAADLKQRSLAGFMRGDQSDSDNGDDEEQLDSADEGGAVRYEVEDVCAVQHDQDNDSGSEDDAELDSDEDDDMEGDVDMQEADGDSEPADESDSEEGSEDDDE